MLRVARSALALGVIAIIVVLILPMPAFLLDVLLAISITFSVLILMTALFIKKPLEFSRLPDRAADRDAAAAGAQPRLDAPDPRPTATRAPTPPATSSRPSASFVMGGNFVIGVIVFAILVIVNFVVITKGSGRIAEVAARFTLDAMPGKQMAIDADLSAGLIDEDEARAAPQGARGRERPSSAPWTAPRSSCAATPSPACSSPSSTSSAASSSAWRSTGLTLRAKPASTYTLLTIGDGLVSQIPALIVSIAAGLLVSKAGVDGAADKALVAQLAGYPDGARAWSSAADRRMALLPGMPILPFLALSLARPASLACGDRDAQARRPRPQRGRRRDAAAPRRREEPIATALAHRRRSRSSSATACCR